jgi:hypothetical protein
MRATLPPAPSDDDGLGSPQLGPLPLGGPDFYFGARVCPSPPRADIQASRLSALLSCYQATWDGEDHAEWET